MFARQKLMPMVGATCGGRNSLSGPIAVTHGGRDSGGGILAQSTLLMVVFDPLETVEDWQFNLTGSGKKPSRIGQKRSELGPSQFLRIF